MEKKGFTLIEIMAVMVVLGLLIAIIVPVVNNLLKDSEDTLHDEQIDLVVKASQKYMVEHSELLPEGSDYSAVYIDDLINSGVIDNDSVIDPKTKEELNGCVIVNYNDSFNQYEYNYRDDCSINIAFDPEGGSVDTTSKKVMIGKTYGELPEPTREGYRFLGWSGKNMFSKDNTITNNTDSYSYVTFQDNSIIFDASSVNQNTVRLGVLVRIYMDNTLIFDGVYADTVSGYKVHILNPNGMYNYNKIGLKLNTSKQDALLRILNILEEDKKYTISYNVDSIDFDHAKAVISNFQLEKGETATEYEPYQEYSSDTIVNKGSDYTLHAIWEIAS